MRFLLGFIVVLVIAWRWRAWREARQLEKTKSNPVPFPTDIDMVVRCSESLKAAIRGAIQNNRNYIY